MAMPIRTWLLGLALLAGSGLAGCANDEPAAPGDEAADNLEARVLDSTREESFVAPNKRPGQPPQTQPVCGTRGAKACGEGTFCDFPAGSQCGAADQGGRCVAKPEACLQVYQPVCGCDGKTYGNACTARSAGVSVASEGECRGGSDPKPPAGKMCGGIAGKKCGQGEYCNYAESAGGNGCGIADGAGVCQPQPKACTREYNPVCGCDGKTYGNKCTAAAAGASVDHEGECGTLGKVCGGLLGAQCGSGEFCNFEGHTNDCGAADGTGVCQAKPEVCTQEYKPVCGCDDHTYGNRCEANGKGIAVLHDGACDRDPGNGGAITCDPRQVLCRRAEPVCPAGQVASVEGSCWGPCVKLEACTCSQEDQCPHREQYVCHRSAGHCGPYVR